MLRAASCAFLGLTLLALPARAQDSHYWTHSYGSRANLLQGLVVGDVGDLSGTYYNPGSIALSAQSRLVTSSAVDLTSIELENGAGRGLNLGQFTTQNSPSIFALRVGNDKDEWGFAVSYLTRQAFDVNIVGRRIDSRADVIADPSVAAFAGEFSFGQRLSEWWGGLTVARRVRETVGIGLTPYVAYRSQRGRIQTLGQRVDASNQGSAVIQADEFSYWSVRALAKLGLAMELRPWTLGFTLTTPGVHLIGTGNVFINTSVINLDPGNPSSELAADYQKDLGVRYKSPLSLAAGATFEHGGTRWYASGEWFGRVPDYQVIDARPFASQTSGVLIHRDYALGARAVANVGVGVAHAFRERLHVYGAFATDFSAKPQDLSSRFTVSNWDIYHLTTGSAFTFRSFDLTLGLSYSFGDAPIERPVDFSIVDPTGQSLTGSSSQAKVRFTRIKLVFGLTLPFVPGDDQ